MCAQAQPAAKAPVSAEILRHWQILSGASAEFCELDQHVEGSHGQNANQTGAPQFLQHSVDVNDR